MSGWTPSPSQGAKPFREVGAEEARLTGDLVGEALEALGGDRVAVDADQRPVEAEHRGDAARVAPRPEGAVDRDLARLRAPAARPARWRGRACARSASPRGSRARGRRRRPAGARLLVEVECSAWTRHLTRSLLEARPSAISGAVASSSSSCLAQASAFQISRYSPAPITTQGPERPACSISGLGRRMRPAESSLSSKEPPWKRRRRLRASLPKGLCGARKRSESCSNSSVVCTQTQGSKPLERTTPSESAARKREGTVRRSLESRLCS